MWKLFEPAYSEKTMLELLKEAPIEKLVEFMKKFELENK